MKHHILRDFRTSTPLKENFSHDLKDFHKLKLSINCDVHLTSSPGEVMNNVLNV